jgi:hypothetical protein
MPLRAAVLLLLCLLLAGCARVGGDPAQWSHNTVMPLSQEGTIGQTFGVASDALVGVDVLMATFGQVADPAGALHVDLRDATTGDALATTTTPGGAITDNAWAPVRFDPPVDVDGPVAIELSWAGASPVAVRANRPRGQVEGETLVNDPYPDGQLLLDGEPATGDLAFRVVGSNGPQVLPATVARLLRGAVSGLLEQPLFAAAWSGLLLGCLVLAVAGTLHHRRRHAAPQLAKGGGDEQGGRDGERGPDEAE